MARPERHDVDYFPFFAKRGKTLNILQAKYGLEGIGFFTNLMRFLALTPDHFYCIAEESDRLNFYAEIGIEEEKGTAMIELMVKTEKLNKKLWEEHKVIACDAFLKSLEEAYRKRSNQIITIEKIMSIFEEGKASGVNSAVNPHNSAVNPTEHDFNGVYGADNPQRKVKKSKVKKSKENNSGSIEPPETITTSKSKPKKLPLREREPVNDFERVEKAYITNWTMLYSQGKVKTPEPVVSWGQVRKLLKNLFAKLKPEQIIQAVNGGMEDERVMKDGYSLSTILTSWVLNRLINAQAEPQVSKHQREKLSLE